MTRIRLASGSCCTKPLRRPERGREGTLLLPPASPPNAYAGEPSGPRELECQSRSWPSSSACLRHNRVEMFTGMGLERCAQRAERERPAGERPRERTAETRDHLTAQPAVPFIARRELLPSVQGLGMEVIGRVHLRRRCRCASSRGATACRSRGVIRSARTLCLPPSCRARCVKPAARGLAGWRAAPRTDHRPGLPRTWNRPRARAARGGRPRGRRRGAAGLGAAVYGTSEGLDTLIIDSTTLGSGRLAADRELPRIPSRDERLGADKPCGHASAKVRRPVGNPLPRAFARNWKRTPVLQMEDDHEIAALAVALLRHGHPRPQRDRGAAWRRRRTRGRDAGERRASTALVLVSVPRRTAVHRVARRRHHARRECFILTGGAAGAEHLLESPIPGVVQPVTSASALG